MCPSLNDWAKATRIHSKHMPRMGTTSELFARQMMGTLCRTVLLSGKLIKRAETDGTTEHAEITGTRAVDRTQKQRQRLDFLEI